MGKTRFWSTHKVTITVAVIGAIATIAAAIIAVIPQIILLPAKNKEIESPVQDKAVELLDFVRIHEDNSVSYFEEVKNTMLPVFSNSCNKSFSVNPILDNADIGFDVTLLNTSNKPLILTKVGIKILKVAELNIMPLGEWKSFSINKEDGYRLDIPDIYGQLGDKLDYKVNEQVLLYLKNQGVSAMALEKLRNKKFWLTEYFEMRGFPKEKIDEWISDADRYRGVEAHYILDYVVSVIGEEEVKKTYNSGGISRNELLLRASNKIELNENIVIDTEAPIYLEKEAPFRYGLIINDYVKNMPNYSVISLYAGTDKGEVFSEPLCIEYFVVRER